MGRSGCRLACAFGLWRDVNTYIHKTGSTYYIHMYALVYLYVHLTHILWSLLFSYSNESELVGNKYYIFQRGTELCGTYSIYSVP